MPYARKFKKTRKYNRKGKKSYRKRKMLRSHPQRIIKVGFPKQTCVKLRYVDGFSLNPGVSSLAQYLFRANSCFDPNYSAIGHQPSAFDNWSQFYNHYTVLGAKITAQLHVDPASVQSGGIMFGIHLSDDISFTADPTTAMEQGLLKYRMGNVSPVQGSGNGLKVTKTFSAKKFFNVKDVKDNTGRLGALTSANPTDLAYFMVIAGPTPASTSVDLTGFQVTVIIDYIVLFSEPMELPLS